MAACCQRIAQRAVLLGLVVALLFSSSFGVNGTARPLSVALVRVVGYSIGYDIQGNFQLIVQGPSNLTHVEIRFNATLVHNTTAAQFVWSFRTDSYPLGWTNITVQGWDSSATLYQWSQLRRFVPVEVNTPFWIAAILFLGVFIGLLAALALRRLR